MRKTTKKTIKAMAYIVIATVLILAMGLFIAYMYFSGTFLAGQFVLRKVLYAVAFLAIAIGIAMMNEALTYLEHRRNRRRR